MSLRFEKTAKISDCQQTRQLQPLPETTIVAPWPAEIAPKFKALGKAQEFSLVSVRFPLLMYLPRKDRRLS